MISDLRQKVFDSMKQYRELLQPDDKGWKILEVGTDGDEFPSGNFKFFGKGNTWKTLDYLPRLKPDYVADITDTKMPSSEWDLIICSQTLEHVYKFHSAINEIYRMLKPGGYAILDCPFEYPYHGTEDYGDYWRISDTALAKLAIESKFAVWEYGMIGPLSTGLFKKI